MPLSNSAAERYAKHAAQIYERARIEERDLTPDESEEAAQLVNLAEEHAGFEGRLKGLLEEVKLPLGDPRRGVTSHGPGGNYIGTAGAIPYGDGPGGVFVNSEGFKSIADASRRPREWSTGLIPVGAMERKGTLLEGSGSPGSGSGGGLLPVPQVAPGVVETLFQPLSFERLLSANQATGNTVRYIVEGTATSGATGVAEAGTKPESTLGLSTVDEPIKKVATSIVTSDELLEDITSVQAFVNERLATFVQIEVEKQLFRGTAASAQVQGILTSRGVPVYAGGTAAGNMAEQLFKAMNGMRGSAYVEPDFIVCHPTDWQTIRLLKDSQNQLLGGGPFLGQYGAGQVMAASGQVTGAADSLWGKGVYVTAAIGGAGTALVGNSRSACVWSRGGPSVEATNSHASLFVTDQVCIRCERRLALAVYRSGGFVEVRLS